ncbi:MAG: PAC2 family protein [Candidatus Nanopelagicales bacterium]|nr:PAC2 family protein [Candidatus Nanopelagicales bacterium]
MRDPAHLVTEHQEVLFSEPPVLVHAFSGFVDAGSGVRLLSEHILNECDHTLIASFDIDELLDYRARRPRMQFVVDHFASVDMPRISLHDVTDANGKHFLLLEGPEPDYQWNRFIAAVEDMVRRYGVTHAVGLSAIPWPMPHTRPLGLTVHGNDQEAIFGAGSVIGEIEVPGHVGAMLELRLGEIGLSSIGITAQIPHYLSQFEYPHGAVALLDGLAAGPDLAIPRGELPTQAARTLENISEQLVGNEEFAAVVTALETQYDQIAEALTAGAGGLADADIPTADQIAAQVEAFLAEVETAQDTDKESDT